MPHYDAVIIGFGKAGKTLAPQIAARGRKVAIVEKSPLMYGGTCPNVGCIPSKALITRAKEINLLPTDWEMRRQAYRRAIQDKNELTAALRSNMYNKLTEAGVEIIDGTGSFIDNKTLNVTTANGRRQITSDKFFINTGAVSFIPPIKGIDSPRVYTSETLMNLSNLPQTLVIIGGGYIGLEFASMYANFGSKVVVLQDLPDFLPREDNDISEAILKRLKAQGVEFHFGVKVEELADLEDKIEVKYQNQSQSFRLKADAVLVATGRRPATRELNAAKAGIELMPNGAVKVNTRLQTTNPIVWAMGDVNGGLQFTYISLDDSRIVRSQLPIGGSDYTTADRKNIPYSVFIDPTYSRVGMNEKEATAQNRKIKIAKLPAAAIPRAKAIGETDGLLKAVIDAETSQILGMMLFCAESYEVINLVKLAMDQQISYTVLRDMIYTHPSMSEALNDLLNV